MDSGDLRAGRYQFLNDKYEARYNENQLVTNIVNQWTDGNNIEFYVPIESQTKIFLPDTEMFRKDNENLINTDGEDIWSRIFNSYGINVDLPADYGMKLANVYNLSLNSGYDFRIKSILKSSIDILTARKH